MTKNIQKSLIAVALTGLIAFAPLCQANARSYHRGDTIIAAAIGGAVAGLVGGIVQDTLNPGRTVVVEQPAYVVEEPVVVRETVVVHEPYYRPVRPIRRVRHYYRYY